MKPGTPVPVTLLAPDALLAAPKGFNIVDARRRHQFEASHIPGAISIEWEDWCDPAPVAPDSALGRKGYWGVLRSAPDDWYGTRLSACGLSSAGPTAVYADGPRSRGREGRIAWMLLYLGARHVALLDGGWRGWLAAGGSTECESTPPTRGSFAVNRQTSRRCTLPELADGLKNGSFPQLVDTRSPEEFSGYEQPYLPRRGHLPGAVNFPFSGLFGAFERFVDLATYSQRLNEALSAPERMVAYCEVGVRASLFALIHEMHTGHQVPVYDGSLIEWSLHPELPMEPK